MKKIITTLAVLGAALVLSSCASTNPAATNTDAPRPTLVRPTIAPLTDERRDQLATENDQAALDRLLEQYPDAQVPSVSRIRFLEEADIAPVMAECMTAAGFAVSASPDGGWGGMLPTEPDERVAYEVAIYSCMVQYPADPKYSVPLNESQLIYLYDYNAGPLRECLERNGYTISDPPSLDSFARSGGAWTPFADTRAGSLWQSLIQQCPQHPEGLYGEEDGE